MSEPKYPRCCATIDRTGALPRYFAFQPTVGTQIVRNGCENVILMSLPEHESIVAAAVAAAVERCAGILEDEARCDEVSGFHGKAAVFREFANKIREVPT